MKIFIMKHIEKKNSDNVYILFFVSILIFIVIIALTFFFHQDWTYQSNFKWIESTRIYFGVMKIGFEVF